jgi:hypothetical protein
MRHIRNSIGAMIAVFLLALVANIQPAQAQGPWAPNCWGYGYFQVYGPYEGQQVTQGDNIHIDFYWGVDSRSWCGGGNINIGLWYSSDYGYNWTAIDEKIDWYTTGYDWTVPTNATPQYGYMFRVQEVLDQNYCWSYGINCEGYSSTFEVIKGCFPPVISSFTPSQSVCSNNVFTFNAPNDATRPTYQWRKDGVVVAVTGSSSYTLNPVRTTDAGVWDVIVIDECGATSQSSSSRLTVTLSPTITQQPVPLNICQGRDDTLKVRAIGPGRAYQWRKDGVAIVGARDSNYVIVNASTTSNGSYDCVVSGTCSPAATSTAVQVTALVPPVITSNPSDQTVCLGSPVTLSMSAAGAGLSYFWYKDGVSIAGATSATYTIPSFTDGDIGRYQGIATVLGPNPQGCNVTARSREVFVSRFASPKITTQPASTDGCLGGSATLTIATEGFDLSYQWFKNGVAIPNVNSNSLVLSNLTPSHAGAYTVRVSGTCGFSQMSTAAVLSVIKQPTIVTGPVGSDLTIGDPLTLSVSGTDVRGVQWLKNNRPIPNATGTTFGIPSVAVSDAGVYSAVLTNMCGAVTTGYAVVRVTDPSTLLPELTVSQLNVDAGDVPVEYSRVVTLTNFITNTGKAPLTVTGLQVQSATGTGTFTITQGGSTPFTLAPGEQHSIGITFDAPQVGGSAALLQIASNTPSGDVTVGLSGRGVLRYTVPASLDLGKIIITNSGTNCANVMNTSNMSITLDQALISGTDAAMFSVQTTLPITIAAGATAQICVKFSPTSIGTKDGLLSVRSSDGGNTTFTLTGSGDDPTGITPVTGSTELNAYPNPSSGVVNFQGSLLMPGSTLTVMNAIGSTVAVFTCGEPGGVQWLNDTVPTGTYMVIVRTGDSVHSLPIAVVR